VCTDSPHTYKENREGGVMKRRNEERRGEERKGDASKRFLIFNTC
jgi:hypothetical protein